MALWLQYRVDQATDGLAREISIRCVELLAARRLPGKQLSNALQADKSFYSRSCSVYLASPHSPCFRCRWLKSLTTSKVAGTRQRGRLTLPTATKEAQYLSTPPKRTVAAIRSRSPAPEATVAMPSSEPPRSQAVTSMSAPGCEYLLRRLTALKYY